MSGAGYPGPNWQGAQPAPPDSNLVWAILATVLCCLPLGIVAIVKSTQVSGLWAQGRYADAQYAADDAKKWAMWSAIAGVIVAVVYVIIAMSGAVAGMSTS
jgi:Interferon-induced transmembrane protein